MSISKSSIVSVTAIVLAGLSGSGAAQAGTVTATFTYDHLSNIDITASGGIYNGGVNTVSFHWTRTDAPGAGVDSTVPLTFDTYCVDLSQTVSPSNAYTFDAIPIASAGYTPTQMDLIRTLWATSKSTVTDATQAAAFQAALWELVYDTNNDITTGTFKLNSPNSVITAATAMLTTALAMRGEVQLPSLVVLRSDRAQDQICETPNVPTPGATALAAFGLLLAARRTRKQA